MAATAIPLILSGISGLAGLFGGKPKQQQQNNTSNTDATQTSSGFSSTTPELSGLQQLLSNMAGYGAVNMLQHGPADLEMYKASGLQAINQGADIQNKLSKNILASRGLSASPYAGYADILSDAPRVSQQDQLLGSLPLLARQFQSEDLNRVMQAFGVTGPVGSTSTANGTQHTVGTTQQSGTEIQNGNPLAGLFGGAGAGLAASMPYLMNSFGQGGNNNGSSTQPFWQTFGFRPSGGGN